MAGAIGTVTKPGLQLSVTQFKKSFFDTEGLRLAVDRGLYEAKSRFGAFLMRRIRSSIRNRNKKPSKPGQTPTNQVGTLKQFTFFAHESRTGAVVVGPARTNQRNVFGRGGKTIPQVLEQGGLVGIHEHQLPSWFFSNLAGQWVRTDFRYRTTDESVRSAVGRPRRIRWAYIKARPFVKVSAEKEIATGKHAQLMRGVIGSRTAA